MPLPQNVKALLALDLGTYCGYAVKRADGSVHFGEQPFKRLKDEREGLRLWRFSRWLIGLCRDESVEMIAFEDVLFQTSQAQTRLWSSWLAITLLTAEQMQLDIKGLPTNVVKLTASGYGNSSKPRMIATAKSLFGITRPLDDNEADALCVLYTAEQWLAGKIQTKTKTPKPRKGSKKQADPQARLL